MGQQQYGQGPDPWAASGAQQGYPRQQPQGQPYGYQPQYPPQGYPPRQQPRKSRRGLAFLGCGGLGAIVVLAASLAASHGSSSSSSLPAVSQPAVPVAGTTAAPAAQSVTYEVTGSPADVTYGPAGTELSGSVPMGKTDAIPSKAPLYYSVQAQLQGSGTVSCKILIGGKTVSSSTATGGYNIALCEVVRDPLTGGWQDANT
jgi:hypothetical protein